MFTFGRERHKETVRSRVRDPRKLAVIDAVIDTVHDVLESGASIDAAVAALAKALHEPDEAVWNEAAIWLSRLQEVHGAASRLWDECAGDVSWRTRFNVAASLDRIPADQRKRLAVELLGDRSAKVRRKVADLLLRIGDARDVELLARRLVVETDPSVVEALEFSATLLRGEKIVANGRATFRDPRGGIVSVPLRDLEARRPFWKLW